MKAFLSVDFLKIFIPLVIAAIGGLSAAIGWLYNEWRRRQAEEYLRKEERYQTLLRSFKGFYTEERNIKLQQDFIDQVSLCWLYCPDEVILKANNFLKEMKINSQSSQEVRNAAGGELIAAIRRDLISRKTLRNTSLTGKDFERAGVANQQRDTVGTN